MQTQFSILQSTGFELELIDIRRALKKLKSKMPDRRERRRLFVAEHEEQYWLMKNHTSKAENPGDVHNIRRPDLSSLRKRARKGCIPFRSS